MHVLYEFYSLKIYPEEGQGIEKGRLVSLPADRTPAKEVRPLFRAGCINTRTLLRKGYAWERIGTTYLRSVGTSPLKGASLNGEMYKYTIRQEGDVKDARCLGNVTS